MTGQLRGRHSGVAPPPRAQDTFVRIRVGGEIIPVRLRRNRRARQLILRVDSDLEGAVVTLPPRVALKDGIALASSKAEWILGQLAELPPRIPFIPGARIPLFDKDVTLRHRPEARRGVWHEGQSLYVSGSEEHFVRRVRDWMRAEARAKITDRVETYSERLGRKPSRIVIRDTRSRWGSCAADGTLSFCWRLVMAPTRVLDYVVAHEVSHLKVPDHSARFWRTVESIFGPFESPCRWLDENSGRMHRIG